MTDDVQSPMEDAARDLVDADPGWQPEAEAIMAGVDALIGMRHRLDAALAECARLREEAEASTVHAGCRLDAADRIERALIAKHEETGRWEWECQRCATWWPESAVPCPRCEDRR